MTDSLKLYIDYKDKEAIKKISEVLLKVIDNKTAYLCIGTPKTVGDALAPRIGSNIKQLKYRVFGTECEPIDAFNVEKSIQRISKKYNKIITIDACIGYSSDIGKIIVKTGGTKPGEGVGRDFSKVGVLSILGIVTHSKYNIYNIQDKLINDMVSVITKAIILAEKNKKII